MLTGSKPGDGLREPYKYLDYYGFEDADLFFGREREVHKTVGEIVSARLLVLFSPSGSGKTSLINAGVRPELESLGYRTVYARLGADPIPSIEEAVAQRLEIDDEGDGQDLVGFLRRATESAGKPLVIFLDQFEEFFVLYRDDEALRQHFIEQLARVRYDADLPVYLVLSLREDYFARLHELRGEIPSIFHHNANVRLERFDRQQSVRAIEGPLAVAGGEIDDGLAERIFEDLADGASTVEPIQLQVVCQHLWQHRTPEHGITTRHYKASGGAEKILANDLARRLGAIPRSRHRLMVRVFEALKTPDGTKRLRSSEDLAEAVNWRSLDALENLLNLLADNKILRWEPGSGTVWYELRHDYLVGAIADWLAEREAKLAKRRFWWAAVPGMVLFVALLIYIGVSYATVFAALRLAQYEDQREEIVIERGRPFGVKLFQDVGTTGLFLEDLRGLEARNAVRARWRLGLFAERQWERLGEVLTPPAYGRLMIGLGHEEQGLDVLIATLDDSDPSLARAAATALGDVGLQEERVLAALCAALSHSDRRVRGSAAIALKQIGSSTEDVIAALLGAIEDLDEVVRSSVAKAMGEVAADDPRVVAVLQEKLRSDQNYVRQAVALALRQSVSDQAQLVDGLIQPLAEGQAEAFWFAAGLLGDIGPEDLRVQSLLWQAFERQITHAPARALAKLGLLDEQHVDALLQGLVDPRDTTRSAAAELLGEIGSEDERVVEALLRGMRDLRSRRSAARALGKIGADTEPVISALLQALSSPDYWFRKAAAEALGEISLDDARITEALFRVLNDRDSDVRSSAITVLAKLGTTEDWVVEMLLENISDREDTVRLAAAQALGNASAGDERVTAALRQISSDSRSDVGHAAKASLGDLLRTQDRAWLLAELAHRNHARRISAAQALARREVLSEETLASMTQLQSPEQPPWARLGGSEATRLMRQRRKVEDRASYLTEGAARLLERGETAQAARHYALAHEALTQLIPLRDQAAQAALRAARCYARLDRNLQTLRYLRAAFENDPALRQQFETELAQPDSDWESLRDDPRLERHLRDR
ncbi:MAG: HEAT repeat domain-containing protein [Acidobacteriota bacterium]